jgi:hypothetical protein
MNGRPVLPYLGLLAQALAASLAAAQDQRPLPRGSPDALVTSFLRVHVVASEDLEPDQLRALARPQVTLWLETRSNTLRESTVEQLGRFDDAWVRVRAPLSKTDARVFARVPKAGLWLTPTDLDGVVGRAPGVRRLAVDVKGPLDAALAGQLWAARPSVLRWEPGGPVDLLAWSLFVQLPGRKVFAPAPTELLATRCTERSASLPALELHVATLLAMSAEVFPCGLGTRVVVNGEVEPWLLQSLVVRDPALELVLWVADDAARASSARKLLERLALGPGR